MQRKNLFIITYNFGNVKAGPVIRFMRYASLFEENGIDVTFLTREVNKIDLEQLQGINVIYFNAVNNVSLTRQALKWCKAFKRTNIILFSIEFKCYYDFVKANTHGNSLIYVSTMSLNDRRRTWFRKTLLQIVMKGTYNRMDKIVCSTNLLTEEFRRLGLNGSKLHTIPNGVNTEQFSPLSKGQKWLNKEKMGILPQHKVLLYVGLFVERKGMIELYKLWLEIRRKSPFPIHLCLVGQYKDSIENSAQFIAEWPLMENELRGMSDVSIFPFSEAIENYYKIADGFIFMSKLEGMPNVLLEAFSAGLPVFLNLFEGFGEAYGSDNEHYISMTGNSVNDADKIIKILSDDLSRKKLGDAARQLMQNRYSITNSIIQYCDLFI